MLYLYQIFKHSDEKTLVFLNPDSDNDQALKKWQKGVVGWLDVEPDWQKVDSQDIGSLIAELNPSQVVAAGGDGTVNYVASKLMAIPAQNRPLIGVVPLGHGNAVAYNLGIETVKGAIKLLAGSHKTTKIDVIKTNILEREYCLFNLSLGFDAQIVKYRREIRRLGIFSYILSGIRSLILYRPRKLTMIIDDSVKLNSKTVSMVIANGPYIGLKYKIVPESSIDSGFLDCVLFPSKYAYLTNFRWQGLSHPLYFKEGKVYFQAKKVEIKNPRGIQIDGDAVKHSGRLVVVNLNKALECICP